MKKQIKDLTLEEVSKICERTSCDECPFLEFCEDIAQLRFHLKEEVEVKL